jgi:hypothetical protein
MLACRFEYIISADPKTDTDNESYSIIRSNLRIMQIAFIHPRFPSAEGTGATHSATQIVTGLADAGHDITVYCLEEPDKGAEISGLKLRHLSGHSKHPHTQYFTKPLS